MCCRRRSRSCITSARVRVSRGAPGGVAAASASPILGSWRAWLPLTSDLHRSDRRRQQQNLVVSVWPRLLLYFKGPDEPRSERRGLLGQSAHRHPTFFVTRPPIRHFHKAITALSSQSRTNTHMHTHENENCASRTLSFISLRVRCWPCGASRFPVPGIQE